MNFEDLTPELVELVSAVLGFFAVVVASIAAPIVFWMITKRGAATFDKAIVKVTTSADSVETKVAGLSREMDELLERIVKFDKQVSEQLSSLQEGQGRTQGRMVDDAAIAELDELEPPHSQRDPESRQKLVEAWNDIRDLLEGFAADPSIDGRTRAKYSRIDRRNYMMLAEAVAKDGNLPGDFETWAQAISLWYESRQRLNQNLGDRPSRMQTLHDVLDKLGEEWEEKRDSEDSFSNLSLAEEIRHRACRGDFGDELSTDVLLRHYPTYSESYIRQILPNFCEGGFKISDETPPCFERIAHGRYRALCDR